MSNKKYFRISSALKDIVGKDLINDDYVAVFELVKNAYDAHATEVVIKFEDINTEAARIIIKDNGKGMSEDDIHEKWLFLAYSAKREGLEDKDIDYRNRIYSDKPFAGAKGIGRFSADRLGSDLTLETTKIGQKAKTQVVCIDWTDFERNSQKEFRKVPIPVEQKDHSDYGIKHGTVIEITGLRSAWDRGKLLKLKASLSKLINPHNREKKNDFIIIIDVPQEIENDAKEIEYRKIVNGEVKNFIFETLELKTTKIESKVDKERNLVSSELFDGGTAIYSIKEPNKYELLKNTDIKVTLFYLNTAAKHTFARRMGVASRRYGHVFLYKNGFRVYPYGEPYNDPMLIDERKSRKVRSRLGTGEVMGRIEIQVPTDSNLKESSSRGDGLIKNAEYLELEKFFIDVLVKLEKYVIEVQQWGVSIEDEQNTSVRARMIELLASVTASNDIIDFSVSDNFLELIEASQVESAETVVKNLKKLAFDTGDKKLSSIAEKAVEKVKILQEARREAELEAAEIAQKADEATQKLKDQISENLFLRSINTSDYKEMISLLHHVGIYAGTIDNKLKGISLRVQNKIQLTNEELYEIIKQIGFEVKKISNIASFATKAKFNLTTETTELDLNNYIKEYIENIIPTITDREMKIKFNDQYRSVFLTKLKPIEMNIVIDNLVSNARKAKTRNLIVTTKNDNDSFLTVEFKDDGIGIAPESMEKIYNMGYTTTDGSGVGLYHVKEIITRMRGRISIESNSNNGVTFKLKIRENL